MSRRDVVKTIEIPRKAKFLDYSAMAFNGYMGRTVAITSQEDAAVWLGEFDWDEFEFIGRGRVLHFPRNDHCEKIYCNGGFLMDWARSVIPGRCCPPWFLGLHGRAVQTFFHRPLAWHNFLPCPS